MKFDVSVSTDSSTGEDRFLISNECCDELGAVEEFILALKRARESGDRVYIEIDPIMSERG